MTLSLTRETRAKAEAEHNPPAVRCTAVTKRFGTIEAVQGASFSVERGTLMALLGPSGGGKTTTLRLIAGFEAPDQGTIEIGGDQVAGPSRFVPPEKRRVGMVFQDYALFPHMTVRANIAFGLPAKDRERKTTDVLAMVGLTAEADRMPYELSGGQQQRVALARALAPSPEVILLDEPFSNLDAALRDKVRTDVRRILREAGISAVFVTHDQDEAFGLADTVGVMLEGTIVQTGSPEDVYLNPASLAVARFLGNANLLDGTARNGYVACELGNLPIGKGAGVTGPVTVAVRPEMVRLSQEQGPSTSAVILDHHFHGSYKTVTLRLPTGRTIQAIMDIAAPSPPGGTVEVSVTSPVCVFSRE